jgi:DNA-binding MarR family transcriptional regulator
MTARESASRAPGRADRPDGDGRADGRAPAPGSITADARNLYLTAWRWRRAVEGALRSVGLTFTQWLVLGATHALIRESKDAVNQNAVAARAELDRMTVSQVMTALAKLGHVDRGPDLIGRGYRIWVTASGRRAVVLANRRVDAAGEAWTREERRREREPNRGGRESLPPERARRDQVAEDAPDDEDDHLVPEAAKRSFPRINDA